MKKYISITLKVLAVLIVMFGLIVLYNAIIKKNDKKNEELQNKIKLENLFSTVSEDRCAIIELYTIYGNHLNIKGKLNKEDLEDFDLDSMKIILKDVEGREKIYPMSYNRQGEEIIFQTSSQINGGIDLNDFKEGEHYLFLCVTDEQPNDVRVHKLYSLKNNSTYKDGEYYTITKNNENYKIDLKFEKYKNIDCVKVISKKVELPDDVYDIVIDAGHGGRDSGAIYNGMYESHFTLDYTFALKEALEKKGYKVKLTRDKDERIESYGEHSRATTGYETKAKLVLSLHLNSTVIENPEGGVEVYASNDTNLKFAKKIADNIVRNTNGRYSPNNVSRALDGIYVRTYTEAEVQEAIEYAAEIGYEPYETLSTKTPYLFMIRETGGLMTRAYIDGRNTNGGDNPYRNSNIAPEAYLIELGFINSQNDIVKLQNNRDDYIRAIVEAIEENYN